MYDAFIYERFYDEFFIQHEYAIRYNEILL